MRKEGYQRTWTVLRKETTHPNSARMMLATWELPKVPGSVAVPKYLLPFAFILASRPPVATGLAVVGVVGVVVGVVGSLGGGVVSPPPGRHLVAKNMSYGSGGQV